MFWFFINYLQHLVFLKKTKKTYIFEIVFLTEQNNW